MPRIALIGIPVVLVVAIVAAGGWYFFLRSDAPPPVSLAEAVARSEGVTTALPAIAPVGESGSTSASGSASGSAPADDGSFAGAWVVDGASSFVGYRIDEELSTVGSATAVGRTSVIEGRLEFDGSAITMVEVTADLTQLQSDDSRRDGQLRRQALETGTYPLATFVLTEPIAIEGDFADGEPIVATAVGDLTLHGVTNRVELALEGQLLDGAVVVVGSTVIALADYDIDAPSAMLVLSVSDEAIMEMELVFRPA